MRKAVPSTVISTVLAAAAGVAIFTAYAQPPAPTSGKAAPKGSVQGRLTWLDRQGETIGAFGEPGLYRTMSVSPDGKRVAVERTDPESQNRDIWLVDAGSGSTRRFTSDPGWDAFPIWSPDGRRIIFTSNRTGNFDLYQKAADANGNEELLYKSGEGKGPTSWSPDGRFLIYYSLGQPTHVRLLAVTGPADREPVPIVDAQWSSIMGRFSPGGRFIAYGSNESGKNEVSVRTFDSASGSLGKAVVVTSGGGRSPLWRNDGKELYYIAPDGTAMVMDVQTSGGFQAGPPKALFKLPAGVLFWDVAPDGTRFLMPVTQP